LAYTEATNPVLDRSSREKSNNEGLHAVFERLWRFGHRARKQLTTPWIAAAAPARIMKHGQNYEAQELQAVLTDFEHLCSSSEKAVSKSRVGGIS